jgi:hypothetical protein
MHASFGMLREIVWKITLLPGAATGTSSGTSKHVSCPVVKSIYGLMEETEMPTSRRCLGLA